MIFIGGERTRVSADTLVKMAEESLAHRTGLLWLSDFASIFSSCKWCTSEIADVGIFVCSATKSGACDKWEIDEFGKAVRRGWQELATRVAEGGVAGETRVIRFMTRVMIEDEGDVNI